MSATRGVAGLTPGLDVDALWSLCLGIARHRRGGGERPALGPLTWSPVGGYALNAGWSAQAIALFALFKPLLDRPSAAEPWVIGQLGQSLDGCIATHGGDAHFVNGPEVLEHLHRLRALCDAVVVGASTAVTDDPQLTTRRVAGDNPVRVVLDPGLRLAPSLKMFADAQAPTLLACDIQRRHEAAARFGAERVLGLPMLPGSDRLLDLRALAGELQRRGLGVLFVEGGGVTVSRFIAQGCLDRLHLSIAPVVIGEGRPGLQMPRSAAMRDCLRPPARVFPMGADMLWDLDLRASA